MMMRQLDSEPLATDFHVFLRAHGSSHRRPLKVSGGKCARHYRLLLTLV
jgi:hypothetical protein